MQRHDNVSGGGLLRGGGASQVHAALVRATEPHRRNADHIGAARTSAPAPRHEFLAMGFNPALSFDWHDAPNSYWRTTSAFGVALGFVDAAATADAQDPVNRGRNADLDGGHSGAKLLG